MKKSRITKPPHSALYYLFLYLPLLEQEYKVQLKIPTVTDMIYDKMQHCFIEMFNVLMTPKPWMSEANTDGLSEVSSSL